MARILPNAQRQWGPGVTDRALAGRHRDLFSGTKEVA